ncbi:MAG: precorrin-6A reductase [Bacillota bacterium]
MRNIIVIAGTGDARAIIRELLKLNIMVTATVTTEYGSELLEECRELSVLKGKLTSKEMLQLIHDTGAKCLVDASHPFAREASINAINASREAGIPYIRYERLETRIEDECVIRVASFEEAARRTLEIEGKILLTIGSNHLEVFTKSIPDFKRRLFARVLPDSKVLAKCESLGLSPDNIIAVKGPFSGAMNTEMLKHCGAKILVTKDSGEAGGTLQKIKAARELGVSVILVERPEIEYGNLIRDMGEVVRYVESILS